MDNGEGSGYTPVVGCEIHRGYAKHSVLLRKETNFESSLCYDFFPCYNSEDHLLNEGNEDSGAVGFSSIRGCQKVNVMDFQCVVLAKLIRTVPQIPHFSALRLMQGVRDTQHMIVTKL